jgi:hypothetical protein
MPVKEVMHTEPAHPEYRISDKNIPLLTLACSDNGGGEIF